MEWLDPQRWTLATNVAVLAAGAGAITAVGTLLAAVADRLADRTGLGEAVAGAILLGGATSLSGIVLSVTAAWHGRPELAMSNALGGIAVQTAFLSVADVAYRRANLEHAAASAPNMMQGLLLICLLAVVLLAALGPPLTLWGIHAATPVILGLYVYGMGHVRGARAQPMWRPARTRETRRDVPERESDRWSLTGLWLRFAVYGGILAFAGWLLEGSAVQIARETGFTEVAVGVLLTSVATSLPELVTSVAAVRRGALTLAVGGVIGGNAFDTLFAAAADVAYRGDSIYHAISDRVLLWIAITVLMTAILVMGLLRREERGIAGIGFESFAILVLYGGGVALVLLGLEPAKTPQSGPRYNRA